MMEMDAVLQGGGMVLSGVAVAKIADAVSKMWAARHQRTEIAPQPLEVKEAAQYVSKAEFERHVADNARDHENLFSRLNRNDRETSEIKGMLAGIRDDISAIKGKLFKTGK
ncbi:MAG: hypothetical protein IJ678_03305 [Kiritimatiellae bacterium]|nr:hypothetical protein [Kiritimatiellia bacterium]